MDIMIFTGVLLLGGLINFIKEVDTKTVIRISGIYIFIAWVSVVYTWIYYFTGVNDADLQKVLSIFLQLISLIMYGTLGYLAAYIALNFQDSTGQPENAALQKIIRKTLRGVSIAIANTFMIVTLGKSLSEHNMLVFFRQSCYTVWFLYFIMGAEPLGVIGILFHSKLKTGPLATLGLIIVMLVAVTTHLYYHDPFSDSFEAMIQIINLSLLLLIYYYERQTNKKQALTPAYAAS
jgi:hypothetical protein